MIYQMNNNDEFLRDFTKNKGKESIEKYGRHCRGSFRLQIKHRFAVKMGEKNMRKICKFSKIFFLNVMNSKTHLIERAKKTNCTHTQF